MCAASSSSDRTKLDEPITQSSLERRHAPGGPPLAFGRFRMLERIGAGGMGEVFAARDEVIGREIAIKRLLDPAPSSEQIARFLREAKIQGALDHPAIPPVHELAQDAEGRPYLVMKRLTGTTLAEILTRLAAGNPETVRRYPRERLLRAFAEACLAVELAHIRGVIHRDLKPANIMLGDFGEVYVLDWGVAIVVSTFDEDLAALRELRPEGEIAGTTAYMPPEQLRGLMVGARTDVYALGCVLFEILAGRPLHDSAPQPGELPPELAELCAMATAPDYDARLATARQLGEGVQAYLDGDRDAGQRRKLAAAHLTRARAAETAREAMQEAGRALALDPALPGAAELVSRLMLEPPLETPPEVEAALTRAKERAAMAQARLGRLGYLAYAAFVPFMVYFGLHVGIHAVTLTVTTVMLVVVMGLAQHDPIPRSPFAPRLVFVIVGNAVQVLILARLFSPFLLAPGAAALTIAVMLGSPAYRRPPTVALLLATMALAIIGPWVGELLGLVDRTLALGPGFSVISNAMAGSSFAIGLGLAVFALVLIAVTAMVTLRRARMEETAQRQIHLQAWRLEQLVSAPRYRA
jgi:serine/threonine-protein kinase